MREETEVINSAVTQSERLKKKSIGKLELTGEEGIGHT